MRGESSPKRSGKMTDIMFMSEDEEDRLTVELAEFCLEEIEKGNDRWIEGEELEQMLADIMSAD